MSLDMTYYQITDLMEAWREEQYDRECFLVTSILTAFAGAKSKDYRMLNPHRDHTEAMKATRTENIAEIAAQAQAEFGSKKVEWSLL